MEYLFGSLKLLCAPTMIPCHLYMANGSGRIRQAARLGSFFPTLGPGMKRSALHGPCTIGPGAAASGDAEAFFTLFNLVGNLYSCETTIIY
jgi:hypothetical protein